MRRTKVIGGVGVGEIQKTTASRLCLPTIKTTTTTTATIKTTNSNNNNKTKQKSSHLPVRDESDVIGAPSLVGCAGRD